MNSRGVKFELKVLLLLLLGLILVIAIGFATYKRFATLFESVQKASRPDMELVITHMIQNDVNDLSNIVKIKSIGLEGGKEEDYHIAKQNLLANLYLFNKMHAKAYNESAILIDSLVIQKIDISDGLFYAEDPYRVQAALNKVVTTVGYTLKKNKPEPVKVKETIFIKEKIVSEVEVQKVEVEKVQEKEKEERRFRLFRRKSKDEKVVAKDSVPVAPVKKATTTSSITTTLKDVDTLQGTSKSSINKVIEGITKVRVEEKEIEDRIKDSNLDLIKHEASLDFDLNKAFDKLKKIELEDVKAVNLKANIEAAKAMQQITLLAASIGLLLFILGYLIMRYAKKNNRYKIALKKSAADSRQFVLAKEKFMSNVSHELRTPMHAIQGFAEILAQDPMTENQLEYVHMIQSSTQHMSYLLNDVLDLAKLRNEKLKIIKNCVNVNAIINEVWVYSKQLNQKASVEMLLTNQLPKTLFVEMDSFRLRQILLNILSNAIKFTAQGKVEFLIKETHVNSELTLHFQVVDTGIGMTEEEKRLIFEEYTQAQDDTSHQYGGTGLGLTISKRLIELMDGEIEVCSEKNKGTTMTILIPTKVCVENESPIVEKKITEIPFQSILVIDDELYNRKYLEGIIANKINDVYFVETAEKGLAILSSNSVELILLDYRLPGMNGVDFMHKINTIYSCELRPKVIVLTAALDEEQYEELLSLRVNGVLDKPFTAENLFLEMQRVNAVKDGSCLIVKKTEDCEDELSFSEMKKLFGKDQAFYIEMLETFIESTDESMRTIELALQQDDVPLIGHEAHKIASPSKHIGALEMYQLLKQMERNAKLEQDIEVFNFDYKRLEQLYTIVREKVKEELVRIN